MSEANPESAMDQEFNSEFIDAMTRAEDDLSVVILTAAHTERFVHLLLRAGMPNWAKTRDPLLVDGLPLSLGISSKWAYALGLTEFPIYEICQVMSKLRNNAAHLTQGATFKLDSQANKNRIDSVFEKHITDSSRVFADALIERGDPPVKARLLGLSSMATGWLSASIKEAGSKT